MELLQTQLLGFIAVMLVIGISIVIAKLDTIRDQIKNK